MWKIKRSKKNKMDNNDFIKKIVIPDPEISECTEHEVKSKIENICQWKKILK